MKNKNIYTQVFFIKGIGAATLLSLKKTIGSNVKKPELLLSLSNLINLKKILKLKLANKSLETIINKHIQKFIDIRNYKGFRHKNAYPVRGQRTHTNAKTIKKLKKINAKFIKY